MFVVAPKARGYFEKQKESSGITGFRGERKRRLLSGRIRQDVLSASTGGRKSDGPNSSFERNQRNGLRFVIPVGRYWTASSGRRKERGGDLDTDA